MPVMGEEDQRKRSNMEKALNGGNLEVFQQEKRAIYTNMEAKGSCPSFLAYFRWAS
jgi:hypothetical protein